ncbi:hypothetical protein TNCT_406261 [Trichonephila clavata]|uniref:Uncharacterized protein n=1 Tax=Trichonephila clavata TaxID=2740835 RepID=A0A8X6FC69_TRICU|nr:hypothetical protein TNCT_406261 [Trichonephila clavata]
MNSITERRVVIHQVKIDPKISVPKIAVSTSNTLGRSVSAETLKQTVHESASILNQCRGQKEEELEHQNGIGANGDYSLTGGRTNRTTNATHNVIRGYGVERRDCFLQLDG